MVSHHCLRRFYHARTIDCMEYHYHDKNVVAGNPAKDCFRITQHESLAIFIR